MGSIAKSRLLAWHERCYWDTSPVHYLLLTDQIAFPSLFEGVFIPATVRSEMLDPKTPALARQWKELQPQQNKNYFKRGSKWNGTSSLN